MNKQNAVVGLIAVLVVGAIVGGILFSTRHNRVELTGSVLKVRTYRSTATTPSCSPIFEW